MENRRNPISGQHFQCSFCIHLLDKAAKRKALQLPITHNLARSPQMRDTECRGNVPPANAPLSHVTSGHCSASGKNIKILHRHFYAPSVCVAGGIVLKAI